MKCHKQMYYFETAKVRPTKEDMDLQGKVLAFDGVLWKSVTWDCGNFNQYTHWMQMPKAPSDTDQHAFLEN